MSTSERPDPVRADRALFADLVDDAAVFPPGLAALPDAVVGHRRLRRGAFQDLIGPLLVPVADAPRLADLLVTDAGGQALGVGLIARPGTPLPAVAEALATLAEVPGVRVTAVEVAHQPGWQEAVRWRLPVALEVGRDRLARASVLEEAAAARAAGSAVRLKLRTQATADAAVPTAEELAAFILDCHEQELPLKLTGGLHRAVAHTTTGDDGRPEDQHGVLNVIIAVHLAAQGAARSDLTHALARRDADGLAGEVAGLDAAAVAAVRRRFTGFGCCGVLDPLGDLVDLALLSHPTCEEDLTR